MAVAKKTAAKNLRTAGAPGHAPAERTEAHAVAAQIMGEAGARPDHVAARETPRDVPQVALRTFDYHGQHLDRGQVFRLSGLVNDKRMADLRYFTPLTPHETTYECSACGCTFTSMGLRDGHAKVRHMKARYVPPPAPIKEPGESQDNYQNRLDEWARAAGAAADALDERRDKIENDLAPLDLTKTAASRGA